MLINIDKELYKIVSSKYSSVEYLIGETIPAISIKNLIDVVQTISPITNTVSVDISKTTYDEIISLIHDECSIDDVVNYLVGLGFVMEV